MGKESGITGSGMWTGGTEVPLARGNKQRLGGFLQRFFSGFQFFFLAGYFGCAQFDFFFQVFDFCFFGVGFFAHDVCPCLKFQN
jgi:hypothetical protein